MCTIFPLLPNCICAAQIGDSLAEFLVDATPDPKLRQLMMSMSEAIRTIAFKVTMWTANACVILLEPCHAVQLTLSRSICS